MSIEKMTLKRRRSQDLTPLGQPELEMSYGGQSFDYDNTAPRSGKWTPEEERFANRLIHDFEMGLLPDCEDGCTLRSYLARKLNCAPMRISKKFAGKCIGKHVFAKKLGVDRKMYAAYYADEQPLAPPMKYSKLSSATTAEDYYTYNYDIYRPTFQFEYSSSEGALIGSHPRSDSIGSESDQSDALSCASNDFESSSHENGCDSYDIHDGEAAEWRDVLNFFCGCDFVDPMGMPCNEDSVDSAEFSFDFRENQPQFL